MKMLVRINILIMFLILQSCALDYEEELVNGYTLFSEGPNHTIILKYGGGFIPCHVVAYDYNDLYLVAAQIQQQNNCRDSLNNLSRFDEGALNFWIIDMSTDKVFGPLNYNEFVEKKKLLGVNKSLSLELDL